jgi:hypothetical protein
VLNVSHDFMMADLICICVQFCFKHWKTASEMLKGILVTITWTEHRLLIAFLSSNKEKTGLKIVAYSGQKPGAC